MITLSEISDTSGKPSTAEELEANFKKVTISHPRLIECFEELKAIESPEAGGKTEIVVAVVGPPAAGKSRLSDRLELHFLDKYREKMTLQPDFLPVVKLEIPSPADGNFNWKDFFTRLLDSCQEVMIGQKQGESLGIEIDGIKAARASNLSLPVVRRAAVKCLKKRGVRVLILDEAAHFLELGASKRAVMQFRMIKSLASELGIPILLVGSYDLLGLLDYDGQLIRRTTIIHFSRYTQEEWADVKSAGHKAFLSFMHSLLTRVPIKVSAEVAAASNYLFASSLGTAGLLKDLVFRALKLALRQGAAELTLEHIRRVRLRNKELLSMLREIEAGEAKLRDEEDDALFTALRLGAQKTSPPEGRGVKQKPTGSGKSPRKGVRKPGRDPLGEAA